MIANYLWRDRRPSEYHLDDGWYTSVISGLCLGHYVKFSYNAGDQLRGLE